MVGKAGKAGKVLGGKESGEGHEEVGEEAKADKVGVDSSNRPVGHGIDRVDPGHEGNLDHGGRGHEESKDAEKGQVEGRRRSIGKDSQCREAQHGRKQNVEARLGHRAFVLMEGKDKGPHCKQHSQRKLRKPVNVVAVVRLWAMDSAQSMAQSGVGIRRQRVMQRVVFVLVVEDGEVERNLSVGGCADPGGKNAGCQHGEACQGEGGVEEGMELVVDPPSVDQDPVFLVLDLGISGPE